MSQHYDVPSVMYKNRYCDQTKFDIIINHKDFESEDSTNRNIQIENADVKCNLVLIPLSANHCYAKTAVVSSDIFVIG